MNESGARPKRGARRRTVVIVVAMVAVWLVVLTYRKPLAAHWWTYRLARSSAQDRLMYFRRLVALGPAGVAAVDKLLNHPDAGLRGLGVAIVNHTRPPDARAWLARMVSDSDPDVATAAITGLAMVDDAAALEQLARLLASGDAGVAVPAVTGLGRLRSSEAIDLLIDTAETHPNVLARVQAIEELGQLGIERAREVLTRCLTDHTPFEGMTATEHAAAGLLARAAPTAELEAPRQVRPVSHFAAQALNAIGGDSVSTNGR